MPGKVRTILWASSTANGVYMHGGEGYNWPRELFDEWDIDVAAVIPDLADRAGRVEMPGHSHAPMKLVGTRPLAAGMVRLHYSLR